MASFPSLYHRLLVAIAVITVVSGATQLIAPGFVLGVIGAESTPASRHFFAIVGMFMILFGGLLGQALWAQNPAPTAFLWTGLQKLGAAAAVGCGVFRQIFSPIALLVMGFDLLSGILILWRYKQSLMKPVGNAAPKEQ